MTAAMFFRRQVALSALAAAVVLVALLVVGSVMAQGEGASTAALRPAADGSRVDAVSPLAESSRSATWAAGVALVAVGALLVLLLDHVVQVVRFSVSPEPAMPRRWRHPTPVTPAASVDEEGG